MHSIYSAILMGSLMFFSEISYAQPIQYRDPALAEWEALPEKPALRDVCFTSLRYANAIQGLKNRGATVVSLIQWSAEEAVKSANDLPSEPLFPIGVQLTLTRLIQVSYLSRPIYENVAGGFPQWVYRSCLKGRPV